jgi:hypothetical protein
MMFKTTVLILVVGMVVIACAQEPDLHLDIQDKARPSFSFSGRSPATKFEIVEVPQTRPLSKINPYSFKGQIVWSIKASERIKAANWPTITYGEVPTGFSQIAPKDGPLPKLIANKLYVARLIGEEDYTTGFFFEVRNGSIVNVTPKIFGT